MKIRKISRSRQVVALTAASAILLFLPYIFFVQQTYKNHIMSRFDDESKYFSEVVEMGKQNILDSFTGLTKQANDIGETLAVSGIEGEDVSEYFSTNYCTVADTILIYKNDLSLSYGDSKLGSLFYETARRAQASGGNCYSEFTICGDGIERLGVASPFGADDGGTQTVVLLYNRFSLENMFRSLTLCDGGSLGIIDENGIPILSIGADSSWFSDGRYSSSETGIPKGKLLKVTRTTDGNAYSAYAKQLGINNWLVIYMVPEKDPAKSILTPIYIYGIVTVLLVLIIIGSSIYWAFRSSRSMELFKKKFRIATSQSARAAFEYDRRTDKLIFISDSEYVRLPKPNISLMELGNYVHPIDRPIYYQSVTDLRSIGTTSVTVRMFSFCGREVYRWYHVTATRLTDKGEGKALTIGSIEDIDEQENERLILREKATTDSLTGLWNRSEIEKEVNERLAKLEANEHSVFALMDLDGFKEINDKCGHDIGDKALIHFAEILRSTFRFGDLLGRLGGDEFVVYMALTAEKDVVGRRLKELTENLARESASNEIDIPIITCSIGCCIASKGDAFESVYKRADDALYESKIHGKNQFTIVD